MSLKSKMLEKADKKISHYTEVLKQFDGSNVNGRKYEKRLQKWKDIRCLIDGPDKLNDREYQAKEEVKEFIMRWDDFQCGFKDRIKIIDNFLCDEISPIAKELRNELVELKQIYTYELEQVDSKPRRRLVLPERKHKNIFLICPVREMTDEEKEFLNRYMNILENRDHKVHFPPRDTNQVDQEGGINICSQNRIAIIRADEIHIYWNPKSQGSLFDVGMAFMALRLFKSKRIKIINRKDVEKIVDEQKAKGIPKSFEMVLLKLDFRSNTKRF